MSEITKHVTSVERANVSSSGCSFVAKRSDGTQVHDGFTKMGCVHLFKGFSDDDDKDYLHLCGVEEIDEIIATLTQLRADVEAWE